MEPSFCFQNSMYDPNCPLVTLDQLKVARKVVRESGLCVRTPIIRGDSKDLPLPPNVEVFLKMEAAQNSGEGAFCLNSSQLKEENSWLTFFCL